MFSHLAGPLLLLLVAFSAGQGVDPQPREMTYEIKTTWDNRTLDHDPVKVTLIGKGEEGVEIKVDAPFFGVPENPGGKPGEPFDKLWDYEVVEVFFADDDVEKPKYLEVELSPWGQHLVLLLDGVKNAVHKMLPITFTASINSNSWTGSAIIPAAYFPPKVTRFNAYAIHDVAGVEGDPRRYESLFPVPNGKYSAADFHRLDYFKPLDFESLQPGNTDDSLSDAWLKPQPKSLPAVTLRVNKQVTGGDVIRSNATVTLEGIVSGENATLNIKVVAVFVGGSKVPSVGEDVPLPAVGLDTYETVRVYLSNPERKILELIFSPYGPYDIKLNSAPYNALSRGHRLDVKIRKPDPSLWAVNVVVPLALLPANITRASIASVYMSANETYYETIYSTPDAAIALPDLYVLERYRLVNLFPPGVNDAYSNLWDEDN